MTPQPAPIDPEGAADFERRGIAAYIHVPTAELLRQFLDQGARRFVFEGRECGGHIGPLCSLMLWETQINLLLEKVPRSPIPEGVQRYDGTDQK